MAQVIIYVGAIAVLVLFAVLLTPRAGRDNGEPKFAAPGILLGVCIAAVFLFVVNDTAWQTNASCARPRGRRAGPTPSWKRWVLPFEIASVLLPPPWSARSC